MRVLCVGASHKTADLALRERLAFSPAGARRAMETLRARWPDAQFAVLGTCNRSEVYVARPVHGHPRSEEVRAFFGEFFGLDRDEYDGALYVLADAEAVRHLCAVAGGLDSLVPGEDQVLAQVRQAHRLAGDAGAAGSGLDELFQLALAAGKEVRARTPIAAGKVSVASVALDCARQALGDLAGKCVLSVGAGKMNELLLRGLRRAGVGRILLANRTPARAAELAGRCGGEVVPFDRLADALALADLVFCSTGASDPVVTAAQVRQALAGRADRPMLILDVAVPRDVEPEVAGLPGVRLYNLDHLQAVVEKSISVRTGAIQAGREIIDARVDEYFRRLHAREVVPAIEDLYRKMRRIADEELAAVAGRLTGRRDADEPVIRRAFHRALRRILHTPIANLRSAAGTEAARQRASALRKLFDLPEKP